MSALLKKLESHYRTLATRIMTEVPIANPALEVETFGFTRRDSGWCGILMTPWFMNLVYIPDESPHQTPCTLAFPGGGVSFQPARGDGLERFWMAQMISPLADFPTMDYARAVAQQILQELLTPSATPSASLPTARAVAPAAQPLSRRGFFSAFKLNS